MTHGKRTDLFKPVELYCLAPGLSLTKRDPLSGCSVTFCWRPKTGGTHYDSTPGFDDVDQHQMRCRSRK